MRDAGVGAKRRQVDELPDAAGAQAHEGLKRQEIPDVHQLADVTQPGRKKALYANLIIN